MRLIILFGCVVLLVFQGVFGQSSLYLKAPFDAAVFSTEQDSIKFTWNQISGASSYTVQLSNDPGFVTFTAFPSATGTCWIQQADLTGTSYWRVVSSNALVSVVRSFSIIDLTALGSLIYHIHAEDGLNIISNKVANWNNLANTSYNASQGISNARPTWKNNEINGLSTVHFGGGGTSQHSLGVPNFLVADTNFTALLMYRQETLNTTLSYVLGNGSPAAGVYSGGTAGFNFGITNGAPNVIRINGTTNLKWGLRSGQHNRLYENGVQALATTGAGVDRIQFNTIGLRPDVPTLNFHGDLAEVIIYNTSLNNTNRGTVENYLLTKYTPYPDLGPDRDACANSAFLGPIFDPAFNTIQWSTGQTGNPTIQVNQNGWYWVQTEAFGRVMRDSIFVSGLVPQPQLTVSNNTTICYGDTVVLGYTNLLAPGISAEWMDGSTTPTIDVSTVGTYGVTFTNAEGCSFSSIPVTFAVNEFPLTNGLGVDRTMCLNTDLFFEYGTAGVAPYTHLWSDGSSGSSLTPQNIGIDTYSIAVTDALGCVAQDTVVIELVSTEGPLLNFDFDTVCFNTLNTFTDLSTPASGDNIVSYTWIFPNDTLTGASVNYQAALNVPYFVDLVVETAAGCEGRMRDTVAFLPQPNAYFVQGNFCQQVSGSFLASQLSPEIMVSWQWNFGDPSSGVNNTATGAAVSHIFNLAGNYNVQLVATDINGCTDTVVQVVNVLAAPIVAFSFEEVCAGGIVSFQNTSSIVAPFAITNQSWTFGDGTGSNQVNPFKPYLNHGNYTVTLTVTANNTCSRQLSQPIKVHAIPQPNYMSDATCAGLTSYFSDASFVPNGSVAIVEWSFNGGAPVSGFNASHIFNQTGNNGVTQTVTSGFGCAASSTTTVNLTTFLSAQFGIIPGAVLADFPMVFQNQSSGQTQSAWSINGGDTIFVTSPEVVFPSSMIGEEIEVVLVVKNADCSDTISKSFVVLENRTDLAVNQVFVQEINGFYLVGAELENRGSTPITRADLFLRYTSVPFIKETWTGLLEAGEKENYVFASQIPSSVSAENELENFICVEGQIVLPAQFMDQDLSNNEECLALKSSSVILFTPFPNPINDQFSIRVVMPESGLVSIDAYDGLGRKVKTILLNGLLQEGLSRIEVDAASWSSGIYTLVLKGEGIFIVRKVIKAH